LFAAWDGYDLVHLATSSNSVCWTGDEEGWVGPAFGIDTVTEETCVWFLATGVDVANSDVDDRAPAVEGEAPNARGAWTSAYQESLNQRGLEVFALNGADGLEWRIFASAGFFDAAYPTGVRKALVYLDAGNFWGFQQIAEVIAGSPARSTVVMWRSSRTVDEAWSMAEAFYENAVEGWAPSDIFAGMLSGLQCSGPQGPSCFLTAKVNVDLRIREIVEIRTKARSGRPEVLLEDGHALEDLMERPFDVDPKISLVVDVEGIVPADKDISLRLELDGRTIAEKSLAEATVHQREPFDVFRLAFDDVKIRVAVLDGEDHELQAVLTLPRGGESRYAARLSTLDRRCHWDAVIQGPSALLSGEVTGAGIRLGVYDRFTVLQLDSGRLPDRSANPALITGLTFPLGTPPSRGSFDATDSIIGLWSGLGVPAGYTNRGAVDVSELRVSNESGALEIAGQFYGEFKGLLVGSEFVEGNTVVQGRLIGQLNTEGFCGSKAFRWFDAIPRAAGARRLPD
jgi:hypothetical protein